MVDLDPGPRGDFEWCGLNWSRRPASETGGPMFNEKYEPKNVTLNKDGTVTLRVTNPTGKTPYAGEIYTTRRGFGYGTYTCVVDADLSRMRPEMVFGGLFTYDWQNEPTNVEIDICETSAWGGGPKGNWDIVLNHTYFRAVKGKKTSIDVGSTKVPSDPVQTHVMVWEKDRITWSSYVGEGTAGKVIHRSTATSDVPVPAKENIYFNLWVFGDEGYGSPETVPSFEVKVRSMSFVPLGQETGPVEPPEPPVEEPKPPTTDPKPPAAPKIGDVSPDGTSGYEWLDVDKKLGPMTTRNIQRLVGADPDGKWGPLTNEAVQEWFNAHWED